MSTTPPLTKHQAIIDDQGAVRLLDEMRAQDVRLAILALQEKGSDPHWALSDEHAQAIATLIKELTRLQAIAIAPTQAADILTAVYISSINPTTRELLKQIRGDTKRPERERPPTPREERLEDARERLRWAEQNGDGFALICGHVDSGRDAAGEVRARRMQVSFVNGFDRRATNHLRQPHGGFLLALEASRVLWHEAHGFDVIPESEPPDQGCTVPPEGWYCSREPGHDGPCAARRTG